MSLENFETLLTSFLDVAKRDIERLDSSVKELKNTTNILQTENTELKNDVNLLKQRLQIAEGLICQQNSKIFQQNEQLLELSARSMRDNIVIQGIPEGANETWADTKRKVQNFIKDDLKVNPDHILIDRAHRTGSKAQGARQIVAKLVNQDSKDKIFQNVKNLRAKPHIKIQEQLPAEVAERRKRLWPKYKAAKENPNNRVSWALDKLIINGVAQSALDDCQVIDPVAVSQSDVQVKHTEHVVEDGSSFMGHSARITRKVDISAVMAQILQDRALAGATHNMYAYRMNIDGKTLEGHRDDGEHGAGFRLLKKLRDSNCDNCMIVVTRWYGNKHMGVKRFECIQRCADFALRKLDSE
jgi:hypothetical protein